MKLSRESVRDPDNVNRPIKMNLGSISITPGVIGHLVERSHGDLMFVHNANRGGRAKDYDIPRVTYEKAWHLNSNDWKPIKFLD